MTNKKESINENTIIYTRKSRYNYEIIKRMNNRQGIIELERIGIKKPKSIICDPSSGSSGPSPDKPPRNRSTTRQPSLRSTVTSLRSIVDQHTILIEKLVVSIRELTEEMRAGFKSINARLAKQDEFNEIVKDYMESHP